MSDWEDVCKRCGDCCFEKELIRGRVFDTDIPCRYLDVVTRECKVYHKRLDVEEGCMKLDPEKVREAFWLPESCAYRGHLGLTTAPGESAKNASKNRHKTSQARSIKSKESQ